MEAFSRLVNMRMRRDRREPARGVCAAARTGGLVRDAGLRARIQRTEASVGGNIAECCGRSGGTGFGRLLRIAVRRSGESASRLCNALDFSRAEQKCFDKRMHGRMACARNFPPEQADNRQYRI